VHHTDKGNAGVWVRRSGKGARSRRPGRVPGVHRGGGEAPRAEPEEKSRRERGRGRAATGTTTV